MDIQKKCLDVQKICREEQLQLEANTRQQQTKSNNSDSTTTAVSIVPNVDVYRVPNAGHLLMLENSSAFNAAVIVAAGGNPNSIQDPSDLPMVATAAASSTTPSGAAHAARRRGDRPRHSLL